MMTSYKYILIGGILTIIALTAFSQPINWNLVDGKAIAEKKFIVSGKSQGEIYKEVYRWLIKVYNDPEDILKARIEDEYLRGVGYNSNFLKFGAISGADLQYTFKFEIRNDEVILKISNTLLIYNSYGDDGPHPIENYLVAKNESGNKIKRNEETERIKRLLNDFSNSLFVSFENHFQENGKN